jgi:hypothetical protein
MAQGGLPGPSGGPGGPPIGDIGATDRGPWEAIIRWLREDDKLAEWLTAAEGDLLASDRINQLPVWKALLSYQGFDRKRILRNMIRSKREYDDTKEIQTVRINTRVGHEERVFVYTNKETMAADIEFLIFLFVERGSTNRNYTTKSLGEVAGWLIEKYKIDITVNKPLTALAPDVVTLPRIVACFPGKICEYYHRNYGNTLATFLDIGLMRPEGVSRALLCPHFTALIPQEVVRVSSTIHYVSFLVHVVVDDILHKKVGNYTELENIFIYYSAEYHAAWTPQDARISFCDHMGLLTPDRALFLPVIEHLRDFAIQRIRQLRPGDPHLEAVIQDLNRLV